MLPTPATTNLTSDVLIDRWFTDTRIAGEPRFVPMVMADHIVGLIAAACTERPGSSDWFERGFVSYSNAAKTALQLLEQTLSKR